MSTQEKVILTIAVFGFLAYYAKTLVDINVMDVTTSTRILCLILMALLIGTIFALGVLS